MHINGSKESIAMFYVKNVPGWERALRIAMGLAGLAFAAMNWGSASLVVTVVAGTEIAERLTPSRARPRRLAPARHDATARHLLREPPSCRTPRASSAARSSCRT
jgi:hypothetical protein